MLYQIRMITELSDLFPQSQQCFYLHNSSSDNRNQGSEMLKYVTEIKTGDQCLTKEFRHRRYKEHTTILFHSNTLNKKAGGRSLQRDRFGSPSSITRMGKVTIGWKKNSNLVQHLVVRMEHPPYIWPNQWSNCQYPRSSKVGNQIQNRNVCLKKIYFSLAVEISTKWGH